MWTKFLLPTVVALFALAACQHAPTPKAPRADPALSTIERGPKDVHSELSMYALAQLGVPYLNGGTSPEEGFDCSGLVYYVYKNATGLQLPRTTYALFKVGRVIETGDLQPGDLVFYNTLSRAFSHVGIYMGEQRFIHAPSSGGVVRIESMQSDYWIQRYNGARRLLPV
ncbi:MAG TPA: C40 family peptidase [Burkholderiales bacterium]|nr:C40 family peptidase [Burkholderiales bacterium]